MKYFTIDSENNITYYPSAKAWRETLKAGVEPVDKGFSSEVQLADAIGNDGRRLLAIWNSMPGVTPVKKFTSNKVAVARIWKAIQNLGGAYVGAQTPDVAPVAAKTSKKAKSPAKAHTAQPREGTKESQAIAMMKRPGGATLPELMATFGWQAHTVRGFVAGALGKKLGLTVTSTKEQGGERTYTIDA
jgi:hypothetical protein